MSSSSSDEGNGRKRKRGVRNDENYLAARRRRARLQGASYIDTSGKSIAKREAGPDCLCKWQCFIKIPSERRRELFDQLYSMSTKAQQDTYLQGMMLCKAVTRRRPRSENSHDQQRRSYCMEFSLPYQSKRVKICRAAFMSIFGVSPKQVRRLAELLRDGQVPTEKRGGAHHTLPAQQKKLVDSHIRSFTVKRSHYGSMDIGYLDARLNISKMHSFFEQQYPDSGVKYSFYRKFFNYNFRLRFGRPQIDVCSQCEALGLKMKSTALSDQAKRIAVGEHLVHKQRARKFYCKLSEIREKAKNDPRVAGIAFDFMANLPLPNIPVQEVFYLRQL